MPTGHSFPFQGRNSFQSSQKRSPSWILAKLALLTACVRGQCKRNDGARNLVLFIHAEMLHQSLGNSLIPALDRCFSLVCASAESGHHEILFVMGTENCTLSQDHKHMLQVDKHLTAVLPFSVPPDHPPVSPCDNLMIAKVPRLYRNAEREQRRKVAP